MTYGLFTVFSLYYNLHYIIYLTILFHTLYK